MLDVTKGTYRVMVLRAAPSVTQPRVPHVGKLDVTKEYSSRASATSRTLRDPAIGSHVGEAATPYWSHRMEGKGIGSTRAPVRLPTPLACGAACHIKER